MRSDFARAVAFVLAREGGFVDHPADPGGATNFGISQRAYPTLDIRHLTRADAIAIYRRDYWARIHGDALPYGLALVLFDYAVQSGVGTATSALQAALNLLGPSDELRIDGDFGPRTFAATQRCLGVAPERERVLILRLFAARAAVLEDWVQRSPVARSDFIDGFLNRVVDLALEVGASLRA